MFLRARARPASGGGAVRAEERRGAVLAQAAARAGQNSPPVQRALASAHIAVAVVAYVGSPVSSRITLKTMRSAGREVESLRPNSSGELVKKTLILALVYRYNTLERRQTQVHAQNPEARLFRRLLR